MRVPDALIQPIAADEVAAEVARAAVAEPLNGFVNIGGPQRSRSNRWPATRWHAGRRHKTVVVDPKAKYFGTVLEQRSLVTPD